jgi:hypothetical protein
MRGYDSQTASAFKKVAKKSYNAPKDSTLYQNLATARFKIAKHSSLRGLLGTRANKGLDDFCPKGLAT